MIKCVLRKCARRSSRPRAVRSVPWLPTLLRAELCASEHVYKPGYLVKGNDHKCCKMTVEQAHAQHPTCRPTEPRAVRHSNTVRNRKTVLVSALRSAPRAAVPVLLLCTAAQAASSAPKGKVCCSARLSQLQQC